MKNLEGVEIMGISLVLEIAPQKINKKEWEAVYEESLQLIENYPLAMLKQEEIYGINRWVLDLTREEGDENKYWEICGDLESLERAETFRLYKNLNHYMRFEVEEGNNEDDILLHYINEKPMTRVFSQKTQGKNYHQYILAIACLIESRFSGSAILYGDFDKSQAELAVEWANSILKTPINLPIRVDYKKLYNKLKLLKKNENFLKEFIFLAEGKKELSLFIKDNFPERDVFNYYKGEFKEYQSIRKLGAIGMIIDFLNLGYSIENLCDICCLEKDGPQFPEDEFIDSLSSTWIFIPAENRACMDIYKVPDGQAESVISQFGKMYLEMQGLQGMNIDRYIHIDEVKSILKSKLRNTDNIDSIVEEEYDRILDKLESQKEFTDRMAKEYDDMVNSNAIYEVERLIYWKDSINIDQKLIETMEKVKKTVDHIRSNTEDLGIAKMFSKIDDHFSYINLFIKFLDKSEIILSRNAWDWIESMDSYDLRETLILMVSSASINRDLVKALLENQGLFYKFMSL